MTPATAIGDYSLRRDETEEKPGSGSGSGDDTTNTATTVTVTTVTSSTTSTTPYVDLRLRKGDANCDRPVMFTSLIIMFPCSGP